MHPPTLHLRHTHIPPIIITLFFLLFGPRYKQNFLTWWHSAPSSGSVACLSLQNSSKDQICLVVVSTEVPSPRHWLRGSTSLYRSHRRYGVWSCLREGIRALDHPAQWLGDGRWFLWLIETRLFDLYKVLGLPDTSEKVHILFFIQRGRNPPPTNGPHKQQKNKHSIPEEYFYMAQ